MKSTVALVRCESYEYQSVKKAVEKGISLIGGISQFVQAGEKNFTKAQSPCG